MPRFWYSLELLDKGDSDWREVYNSTILDLVRSAAITMNNELRIKHKPFKPYQLRITKKYGVHISQSHYKLP